MNTLQAVYLVENQELLLANGDCIPVPKPVANTVSPRICDLRFVKRWACMQKLLSDGADIGVIV
jgi:hypothetical protein